MRWESGISASSQKENLMDKFLFNKVQLSVRRKGYIKNFMNTKIGRRIRSFREKNGFSQDYMADKLNISRSAYSRIETGETNTWACHIEKLCSEFNIKPEALFDEIDSFSQNDMKNYSSAVLNNIYSEAHVTINNLSDKLIELYEEKIKNLQEEIEYLKAQFKK